MAEDVLVFIDGGFLSKLSKHLGEGGYLSFKIKDFVKNICSENGFRLVKVFYYTAPPYQSHNPTKNEAVRKERYDSFKNSLIKEGITFREGRIQRLKVEDSFVYSQKGVDTLLTIDLSHVREDYPNIERVILVSSDTDFCPIIEDMVSRKLRVSLFSYFDRKRGSPFSLSNHLTRVCSDCTRLKKEDFLLKREGLIK